MAIHGRPTSNKSPYGNMGVLLAEGAEKIIGRLQEPENRENENKYFEKEHGIKLSGLKNPELRKQVIEEKLKSAGKKEEKLKEHEDNKKMVRDIAKRHNVEITEEEEEAYAKNVPLFSQVTKPPKEPKKTQASLPIDPEQLKIMEDIQSKPEFQNASIPGKTRMLQKANVSKENTKSVIDPYIAEAELKEKELTREESGIEKSYNAQKDFINETTDKYKGFETDMKPRLMAMQHMKSEDIISAPAAAFLETLGVPLGALEDPSSELYNKLSQDLLKGLPETYGSRILKVEVDNFLKTIPTLLNSPDGRRMIASNMLKLGEMKEVYYNEMRRQQKDIEQSNSKYPRAFQQDVFDQVKPQIDRINSEFEKMTEIKSVPEGTIPFFAPDGSIKFVPQGQMQNALQSGGRRIW